MAAQADSALNAPVQDGFKVCSKCRLLFSRDRFYTDNGRKDLLTPQCKQCIRDAQIVYRSENSDKVKQSRSKWRDENPDKAKAHSAKHRATAKAKETRSKWRVENPDLDKKYRADAKRKFYATTRGKLQNSVGTAISVSIRAGSKAGRKTFSLLGYSVDDLKDHLEMLFQPGMTWDNYGEWHIDHKVPLAAHNYETPDDIDFKRAWALSNLQPLWAFDNMSKGARFDGEFQPSLAF